MGTRREDGGYLFSSFASMRKEYPLDVRCRILVYIINAYLLKCRKGSRLRYINASCKVEDGTGSHRHSQEVGDVGVSPHRLNSYQRLHWFRAILPDKEFR